jgi:N-acyl-D-aspartate/D-glutamate deacylase
MTGGAAMALGLTDRGTIAGGKAADLVIFDPNVIADQATYDDDLVADQLRRMYPRLAQDIEVTAIQPTGLTCSCDAVAVLL